MTKSDAMRRENVVNRLHTSSWAAKDTNGACACPKYGDTRGSPPLFESVRNSLYNRSASGDCEILTMYRSQKDDSTPFALRRAVMSDAGSLSSRIKPERGRTAPRRGRSNRRRMLHSAGLRSVCRLIILGEKGRVSPGVSSNWRMEAEHM